MTASFKQLSSSTHWPQGKLLVRFDDTNPSKEKDEFVENIIKDIQVSWISPLDARSLREGEAG